MPNFGVFHLGSIPEGRPNYYIRRKVALQLIANGQAKPVNAFTIQMLIVPEIGRGLSCRQGKVYEAAAIELHPRYFSGGLTRTETKPAPFSKCKAARVGHQ